MKQNLLLAITVVLFSAAWAGAADEVVFEDKFDGEKLAKGWKWLREEHPRAEYEMLVSGQGLVNLYRFFHRDASHPAPWDGEDGDVDVAAAVSRAAMEGACPDCRTSLERFVTIYGAEAGNLALKVMATGGIYVAGGIAPKILPVLRDGRFTEAFNAKGKFTDLMRAIPIRVVLNHETALLGAARMADDLADAS